MYQWRPVRGEVQRLDQSLTSPAQLEDFFAREGVVVRGDHDGDIFRFEIAVTGKRRRVATIRSVLEAGAAAESGAGLAGAAGEEDAESAPTQEEPEAGAEAEEPGIVPGLNLVDFAQKMDHELRKIHIEVDGYVVYPNIDLGEVDVTEADLAYADAHLHNDDAAAAAADPAAGETGENAPVSDSPLLPGDEGKIPTMHNGPMVAISDVPFARVPGLAARIKKPVAVLEHGNANVMVTDVPLARDAEIGRRPGFVIVLSTAGAAPSWRNPVLVIRQNSGITYWKWLDTLQDLPHVEANSAAAAFSREELGAGARVRRILDDFPEVDAGDLTEALTAPVSEAVPRFLEVLGLPAAVGEVLRGEREVADIPVATVFTPQAFPERMKASLAYEVSGYGSAPAGMWKVYRRLYLDHPRLLEIISSAQAGLGLAMVIAGARRWNKRGYRALTIAGGALGANALVRILTTQWLNAALEAEGLNPGLATQAPEPSEEDPHE
ncbi:MAG: hypothetical protein QP830_00295 [Actinotignum sanguinis]|uniref:hypothetical protein n=3 Tax=Actinotignum sanguinis TaxID=1445614 RepID=UPI00237E4DCC|nr:hypothetical protein [Actinotignum sanguinis]MDE1552204.1 hypothetical protein [Actinotignum sanguinis]MDE1565477.1 hypothetical protein [Actinotignum sanguinis]MDE1577553.1 hypothetical protein [Actinotignum sanguinis]MDE1642548.1 hypothetical protein [Actinotignum sanguinis]MDK8286152.1 hypothetical protein [Actinotignum sanguinis]